MDNGIVITEAKIIDIPSIITLRSTAIQNLKPIPESEIVKNISEFFIAKVQWIIAGCMRIFPPASYPNVLELGSLVVDPKYQKFGTGCQLIDICEATAKGVGKILISVTDNEKLIEKYQKKWWHEDDGIFSERLAESPGKKLFVMGG